MYEWIGHSIRKRTYIVCRSVMQCVENIATHLLSHTKLGGETFFSRGPRKLRVLGEKRKAGGAALAEGDTRRNCTQIDCIPILIFRISTVHLTVLPRLVLARMVWSLRQQLDRAC